jgi:predicted ABC-type ATPase
MVKPKFRLFAGPNASGKTHVFKKLKRKKYIHTEFYVNADRYEAQIKKTRKFSFNAYRVKVTDEDFKQHIRQSSLFQTKIKSKDFIDQFIVRSGVLNIGRSVVINSYHASFIASYLAQKLLETKQDFAFETVMSHESKVDLLKQAKEMGYKTYFYFIFVDNAVTNLTRVRLRVLDGGHNVDDKTILDRIPRTFKLMPKAFDLADSAYLIDNSIEAQIIFKKEKDILYQKLPFPKIIQKEIKKIISKNKITPLNL